MRPTLALAATSAIIVVLAASRVSAERQQSATRVSEESPSQLAHRFIRLESGMLPNQWNQLSNFFVQTPKPEWNKVHVVDIVKISIKTKGKSSHVSISTNSLGDLDSSLRLSDYPTIRLPLVVPSTSACYGEDYFEFNLLLSAREPALTQSAAVDQFERRLTWRIEDSSFEPLLTLDTAMRYVRQIRNKSSDPVLKANAARSLRILDYYKQGKFLPDDLTADATGGCG